MPPLPAPRKPLICVLWTCRAAPEVKLIPLFPVTSPSMSRPLSVTMACPEPESLMLTPFVPVARMPPITPSHLIVSDFVMVTTPKPPESRQLISPATAVFEMAPAKVLHGAVRLHGLTSSPTPDTHVRVAWAAAGPAVRVESTRTAASLRVFMVDPRLRQRDGLIQCNRS